MRGVLHLAAVFLVKAVSLATVCRSWGGVRMRSANSASGCDDREMFAGHGEVSYHVYRLERLATKCVSDGFEAEPSQERQQRDVMKTRKERMLRVVREEFPSAATHNWIGVLYTLLSDGDVAMKLPELYLRELAALLLPLSIGTGSD